MSGAAIGNRKSWQWLGRSAGVVRSKPRYVEPGAQDLWLPPSHPFFVVFVFVVFVCVYWRQCLYHPVGTPSGWLPGERRSYLRLGRHLSKKKSSGKWTLFRLSLSLSLPLCLSASRPLCLSVSLSLSLSFFLSLSLSLSLKHTHKHTHTLSLLVWYVPYILCK